MDQGDALRFLNADVSTTGDGPDFAALERSLPTGIRLGQPEQLGQLIQGGQAVADPAALLAAWSLDYQPASFFRYDQDSRSFVFGGDTTADEERQRAAAKLGYQYLPNDFFSNQQNVSDEIQGNPSGRFVTTPFGNFRQTAAVGSVATWADLGRAEPSGWSKFIGQTIVGLTLAGFTSGLSTLFTLPVEAAAGVDVAYDVGENLVANPELFADVAYDAGANLLADPALYNVADVADVAYDVGENLVTNPDLLSSSPDLTTLAQTAKTAASVASSASSIGSSLIKLLNAAGNALFVPPGGTIPDGYTVAPSPAIANAYAPPFQLATPNAITGGSQGADPGVVLPAAPAANNLALVLALAGVAVFAMSKVR